MNLLWLCSWYPCELVPYNGDFIKRHAESVSRFHQVTVLHIIRDEAGKLTKDILIKEQQNGQLTEICIYYFVKGGSSLWGRYLSSVKYGKLMRRFLQEYAAKEGKPDLVHVHVGIKAGTGALWVKKKWNIPYVLSEHWSGFLQEARINFLHVPPYLRSFWKKVFSHAAACTTVSQYLADAVQRHFPTVKPLVIPNVVDTSQFFPAAAPVTAPHFIHISGLDDLKNPLTIVRAFAGLYKKNNEARLSIFGSTRESIQQEVKLLGLQEAVSFSDEIPQAELAEHIRKSTALILYSGYETFGCVIIEANACGVPVLVSDIPVFHETVTEGVNGLFVPPFDAASLTAKMEELLQKRKQFNGTLMAAGTASRFDYNAVGKQFSELYASVLKASV